MKIYNAETIVSIEVKDKKVCTYVAWKDGRDFWSKGNHKDGFYTTDSDRYIGQEEDLKTIGYNGFHLVVDDNIAYWRPNVTINFVDKSGENIKFWTIEEANAYANGLIERYLPRNLTIK